MGSLGQLEAGFDQAVAHALGDRHRPRDTGRADATGADVALLGMGRELVVAVRGRRSQADVGGGDLVLDQAGNDPPAVLEQGGEAGGRGRAILLALDVVRRRAEQDVPEDRR